MGQRGMGPEERRAAPGRGLVRHRRLMSTRLSLACSKPVNSPMTGSNRTGFAVASETQRLLASASQVPAHAVNGRTIPRQALVRRNRINSGVPVEGGRRWLTIHSARATRGRGHPPLDAHT